MIETPVRTGQPCHDESYNDGAPGEMAQRHDGDDRLDETPREDISTLIPLCDEAEFTELLAEMVADEAPRVFAVVQEYGERVDGRIAAWGMAFEDHAEVVSVGNGATMNVRSPERAARTFSHRPTITARVVWVNPDAATPPDEIDPT
ncbi:MAG: hypothetical protein ACRDRR_16210 [Pseudonocardiaceae bacterium]